jgi:hypothetical protein
MVVCKEVYDDIVRVWVIPLSEINFAVPFNVRAHEISLADLGQSDYATWLKDVREFAVSTSLYGEDAAMLDDNRKSTVKSTTKRTVGGRYYEVVLTLIINDNSEDCTSLVRELENGVYCFVIQTASDDMLFVRSEEIGYGCVSEEEHSEDYELKATITTPTYNGIQRIID